MAVITLAPNEKLTIQFAECDGEFEVHFDTAEHPKQIAIKETAGLPGSEIGGALEVLYRENFSEQVDGLSEVRV